MDVRIRGAREHNLKGVDVDIGDGLTVVTGVSGSGKTSLVFDTLYHEARRRFLDVFSTRAQLTRLAPANVESLTGVGPAVAVGQNLLNRNPLSTIATACGLHPFLRLLYARFGVRSCPQCGAGLSVLSEDELVERILAISRRASVALYAPIVRKTRGSHRILLDILSKEFGKESLLVDGRPWSSRRLQSKDEHAIDVKVASVSPDSPLAAVRSAIERSAALGASAIVAESSGSRLVLSRATICPICGTHFDEIQPVHFHTECPFCEGKGCQQCGMSGLLPQAAAVRWEGLRINELLAFTVDEVQVLFVRAYMPSTATRLKSEITKRLDALRAVGLGYIQLDRPSPTLSRGESQRVRLAVCLSSRLEDVLHVLDEPTIGQHPDDVARILPAFRKLAGPVVYVEHDRAAAAYADRAIDLGPGAGEEGGTVVFTGTPGDLWKSETITGRYFSLRERVPATTMRPEPKEFLKILGARVHNLQSIDILLPIGRLVVITGVSGSGKSTLVEDVLVPSLTKGKPFNCTAVIGPKLKAVLVDQSPIGHNPRSNPATYTKLSDIIRDLYARQTGLSPSHYSFNRPEGACPTCSGIGAVEVKMRYLPSTWIPCSDCDSQRFSDEVLSRKIELGEQRLSIADFYRLSVSQVRALLADDSRLSATNRASVRSMLDALVTIGLGYVPIGQPSPSLSGGESQRVKLAKFLGKKKLADRLIILDEPTTGLHPRDLKGLLEVLATLVVAGATVVVVEHNLDIVRAADWVIDLGPGAGPMGGQVVYQGPPSGLMAARASATGKALKEDGLIRPHAKAGKVAGPSEYISIRNARANNLKGVDIDIPKGLLTVVTGVSGSGKSSLVHDVLEAEAKRRFLESLSLYERQGIHEGPEAFVESVSGLGVSMSITPGEKLYNRRSTVGTVTEVSHHLAVLLATLGERICLRCGARMERGLEWVCPTCKETAPLLEARHFSSSTYSSACPKCNGIGTLQVPDPNKLIINSDRAICSGALYSPGFFPIGYLCKPYNHGYYFVRALGERYGFDPEITPWNQMSPEAQKAFLFGDSEPLSVTAESRTRPPSTRILPFRGFYGLIGDWDIGGTYTSTKTCTQCNGTRFRPEVLAVRLAGYDAHALGEMPLSRLFQVLSDMKTVDPRFTLSRANFKTILERLKFLIRVGVGYLHLNRVSATLSAGEAQRVRIAGILGSGLTSLTVLLDEPSRGMHPSEVDALADVLRELRHEGNTVVVVEHDRALIRAADHIVEMGPGPGDNGGRVIAEGKIEEVAGTDTPTGRWLRGEYRIEVPGNRREPEHWMIVKGAKENNLCEAEFRVPLGMLVGVCGVSGSGKSTIMVDTIGRALAPKHITTSVAYEPMQPGAHDSIEGAPQRTIVLDQTREHIINPGQFLDVIGPLTSLYAESNDAKALGLSEDDLTRRCSVCDGRGIVRTDMGFLPDAITPCETCAGTGRSKESWDVHVNGIPFPELGQLTVDRVSELFGESEVIRRKLKGARDLGLGYLVLHQPGQTLSGGECQRLKIAKELSQNVSSSTMYILDEPTVGLHIQDVDRLIRALRKVVDGGNTVVVIEHHPNVLSACDWLIELGPGAGPEGGRVIASGTPEVVARSGTATAPYLKEVLEGRA
ncbi:MAG: hypothetical protein C4K47_02195 [Candidatus Thorarchaeota archaeon]|nr:MAG: hypothetical protein C4K47_02195 [Candidatus Thorarchaeota archaeon]